MSCILLSKDNTRLEWIFLCISLLLFVIVCSIFTSGVAVLLVAFSMSAFASIFGLISHKRPNVKWHRVLTIIIASTAAILFTVQLTLLVLALPNMLPYIYDNRLAPGPFILGAICSAIVVMFGLSCSVCLTVKHSKKGHGQTNSSPPSRFIMLPVDPAPVRYT